MLEKGHFTTVRELAAAEKINPSYLSRALRLTLLAPEMAEAVLGGRQPPELQLEVLLWPFPVASEEQSWIAARSDISAQGCIEKVAALDFRQAGGI